jgi:hypothetical protein
VVSRIEVMVPRVVGSGSDGETLATSGYRRSGAAAIGQAVVAPPPRPRVRLVGWCGDGAEMSTEQERHKDKHDGEEGSLDPLTC